MITSWVQPLGAPQPSPWYEDTATCSAPLSPLDGGRISLLEDGDGLPIDDKCPVLNLDSATELAMGALILEHIDHVVEASEGVADVTKSVARAKSNSVTTCPIQPNLFAPAFISPQHCREEASTAQDEAVC